MIRRILLVVAIVVLATTAYLSVSSSADLIHFGSKACLFVHDGLHMSLQCGPS